MKAKRKEKTLAELQDQDWWWTWDNNYFSYDERRGKQKHTTTPKPIPGVFICRGEIQTCGLMGWTIWQDGLEWAAYRYELLRRVSRVTKLALFINLNPYEMDFLKKHFGLSQVFWTWSTFKEDTRPGWSQAVHWNLNLSNGGLRNSFLEFIKEQRAAQGLPEPKGRNSETSKRPSWLWVEMMDADEFDLRKEVDFDSSTLSQAKKKAKQDADEFFTLLGQRDEEDRKILWRKILTK